MEDQAAARLVRRIGEGVQEAIEDHEERMHLPPSRRVRVTAIALPNLRLDDSQVCRAWEMMTLGASSTEAAAALDVPELVLVRCLSEYQPAWRQFLAEREAGV
jgi:hypothetical protein